MAGKFRACFLDRDGTLNVSAPPHEYIASPDDLVILPGVREALDLLRSNGYSLIIVSNQRGVACGKMTAEQLAKVNDRLLELLGVDHRFFSGVYYCTHSGDGACGCRKPSPEVILHAAENFDLDLASSWMIGDAESDVQAGAAAGCRTARVGTVDPAATISGATLLDVARQICTSEGASRTGAEVLA